MILTKHLLRALVIGLPVICVGVPTTAARASRPPVRIILAPPSRTGDDDAVFRFQTRATRTWCRRDGRRFRPCRASVRYTGLLPGRHTFAVRAVRGREFTMAHHRWTVLPSAGRTPAAQAAPEPGNSQPKLVFADEFNGSEVDPTAWSMYDSPGNGGFGLRRPSAFSLDGKGHLVVTATMQNGSIVSGGMAHKTNYRYGRFAFRVRTEADPTGTISGVVLTWPQVEGAREYTENDIYETGPRPGNHRRFDSFIHFGTDNSQRWYTHEADPTQWHTMVMDWTPQRIDIYRDGLLAWSTTERRVIPDVLHHLCIQLDPWSDTPLAGPVRMFVDYVRIYRWP